MKETIYTIPINDAFNKDTECPICEFEREEEKRIIDYTVGASMMEPEERIITNEKGFCKRHHTMIINTPNKLSGALINETHIEEMLSKLNDFKKALDEDMKKRFKKNTASVVKEAAKKLETVNNSCAVCDKLENTMTHFCENILYLVKNDEEFNKKFFSSKGFCIKHLTQLLSLAPNEFSKSNELSDFCNKLLKLETENVSRVLSDVKWFVKKYDYRYKDKDWKNSKDAVERSTSKIVSYTE